MKIKKILLILISMLIITGCTNINKMNYDTIIGNISIKKKANTFRSGYKYFIPNGLDLQKAGTNYAIISDDHRDYYLYLDLINYLNKKPFECSQDTEDIYYRNVTYEEKTGCTSIKKWENNQYLIEIMYNYAKIEVIVDEGEEASSLTNAVTILGSIKYDDAIISSLLENDNLDYTEESVDIFTKDTKIEETTEEESEEEIKDSDYIN